MELSHIPCGGCHKGWRHEFHYTPICNTSSLLYPNPQITDLFLDTDSSACMTRNYFKRFEGSFTIRSLLLQCVYCTWYIVCPHTLYNLIPSWLSLFRSRSHFVYWFKLSAAVKWCVTTPLIKISLSDRTYLSCFWLPKQIILNRDFSLCIWVSPFLSRAVWCHSIITTAKMKHKRSCVLLFLSRN